MAIMYHPNPGAVLMCNFRTGFKAPEMVKTRPVVVVSKKHSQLAIVVPLSTVEPNPFEACHVEMNPNSLPPSLRSKRSFAKCDMVTCVAFWRLDRVRDGIDPKTGKRIWVNHNVEAADLLLIRQALRHVLGL